MTAAGYEYAGEEDSVEGLVICYSLDWLDTDLWRGEGDYEGCELPTVRCAVTCVSD